MTQEERIIDLTEMTSKQCEQFMNCLDTTGFTNYFSTRSQRIKLIYAFKYMNETYLEFKNEISQVSLRQQKQTIVKSFLDKVEIDIPKRSTGLYEEDWLYIKNNWLSNLQEKENIEMEEQEKIVLNKEEIKEQLEEISNKTVEIISEVSLPREEIQREIKVEVPKKVTKRGLWKRQLVHDLITDQILTCEEYLKSKNAAVKKVYTWHIDHEKEVKFKGQILNARWYKEEDSGLQNESQEL